MYVGADILASQHSVKFDEAKRHAVYNRDGYKCHYCGTHDSTKTGVKLSIDHIDSRASGGAAQNTKTSPATNLITACHACNFAKQDKTPREWNAYVKNKQPPEGGIKVAWSKVRSQAAKKIDIKEGEKLAERARAARAERNKPTGPGVQHDPETGQFTLVGGARHMLKSILDHARTVDRPKRAAFREHPNGAEALALDMRLFGNLRRPGAFGLLFDVPAPLAFDASTILEGGIAVLNLCGPIEHHTSWWWASYENLSAQIECALSHAEVRALVLKIDSPGGVAAGMQEAHKRIRRLAQKYGKPIYAYVDEQACSAAYHIASACSEIWMPESAQVGSVGVILCTVDETEALEKAGLRVRYVVTGKRKADLHPGQPVDDAVLKVAQEKVDYHGALFFAAVGKARSLPAATVEGYEAAVFCGQEAIDARLADGLAGWPRFLSLVRDATTPRGAA